MEITERQFALICYLIAITPWGKKTPEFLFDKFNIIGLGYGAYLQLNDQQKITINEFLEDRGIMKPDIVIDNRPYIPE